MRRMALLAAVLAMAPLAAPAQSTGRPPPAATVTGAADAVWLRQSLPLAVVGTPGSSVSLDAVLKQNFGPSLGNFPAVWLTYLVPGADGDAGNFSYWDPSNPVVTRWLVGGVDIGDGIAHQTYVGAENFAHVQLQLGNQIGDFAFLTVAAGGPVAIQFSIITLDPAVAGPKLRKGTPTPADILAAAQVFDAKYRGLPNTVDCGFIVNDIAAAAGAMENEDDTWSLDPTQNQSGGFWRVVYRGSDPNPVSQWHTLVQPGDIVRMGWQGGGSHTTLVLSVDFGGVMTVIDNGNWINGQSTIGIHAAQYDLQTIPTTITIYRLAPDHLYLIQGAGLGDWLPGNLYNDRFVPNGAGGTVAAGLRHTHVADTAANLDGTTISALDPGDTVDATDLPAATATASFDAASAMLTIDSHAGVATRVLLPGHPSGRFVVTDDGGGGTTVTLRR